MIKKIAAEQIGRYEVMSGIETLAEWVRQSKQIVFFGGAGVSTESGIPDFRGVDGLYRQKYAYPPETILSHTFFMRKTEEFYHFYRDKMLIKDAKPNPAHLKLAQWESEGKLSGIVTQNIDGLHQAAGSKKVFELHGSVLRNYCMDCGKFYTDDFIRESEGVPGCTCGGTVKPDVVLYEEGLDNDCITGAIRAIESADMMIVGGTSLNVYPAASLREDFRGSHLVLCNMTPTPRDSIADLILRDPIGSIFAKLP